VSGQPYVRRSWRYVELKFRGDVTQTRMSRWFPGRLQVGYTRTMLAALWLHPAPRTIGIVGFGGGAQAKFCHRHLPGARIEAVESDPGVLALRDAFGVPADDARLQVQLGDGAEWLRQRRRRYDLLLLDAYDRDGIPARLSTAAFYDDCRAALTPDGAMAVNLYATDTRTHLARLRRSFDGRVLKLQEPGMANEVVFAWNGAPRPASVEAVLADLSWSARRQLREGCMRLATAWMRQTTDR